MITRPWTPSTLVALSCALILTACGGDPNATPDPTTVQAASSVSECGGFATRSKSYEADSPAPTPYCDAEALRWRYDAITKTLILSDDRVLLNCCGDHTVQVKEQNGVFVVHQKDAPEKGARCDCMCVFDYKTTLTGVSGGSIDIEIVREVTDEPGGAKPIWSGTLDLTRAAGEIVIDKTNVAPWCEE
ncbi:MAG: hypothetical protein CSA65_07650 [Proteobacteria bacterium]|nr:MAG: hypothetical protein CSA65_07650 [Pseudomonadota bacterium]